MTSGICLYGGDGWAIEELGPIIRTATDYACGREGKTPSTGTVMNNERFRNGKWDGDVGLQQRVVGKQSVYSAGI